MSRLLAVAATVVALSAPSLAGAQTINAAATGLASPASTVTFEGNVPVGGDIGATYAGQGVSLTPGIVFGNVGWFSAVGGGQNAACNFCGNSGIVAPFDVMFAWAVNGSAFQFYTNPNTTTFTAYLNNVAVSSFSSATSYNPGATWFYGFDQSVQLDRIRIATGADGAMVLDNLQIGAAVVATPEPASLALLGTGLLGIAGVVRRRRVSASA
ncbi:MAG: sorting protein [Gemmatimonadetes bacterium]|nr:sorting protein [Gemmatimonadota bacterium]